jgi:uncharacterized HhH-GPD family protein
MPSNLPFTDNPQANDLLADNPLAAMVGMLLDQQFPMERAFLSPFLLAERMNVPLTAENLAALDDDTLQSIFQGPPALHRFPGSMGMRARDMARHIVEEYGGDPSAIWKTATDGKDLYTRLRSIPGFGEAKARIFVGVIGKRMGQGPAGWESDAADWLSIADVDSFDKILELREYKRAQKEAQKAR